MSRSAGRREELLDDRCQGCYRQVRGQDGRMEGDVQEEEIESLLVTLNKTKWPCIGYGKLRYTAAERFRLTDSCNGQECVLRKQPCIFILAPPSPPG